MSGTVFSLIPPVVAIALALATKEVYLSLLIGILSGAVLYVGQWKPWLPLWEIR